MDMLERAARAMCDRYGYDPDSDDQLAFGKVGDLNWNMFEDDVRAVIAAISEPIKDAAVYLRADAEAWETGAQGSTHEVYLMHCGKLRRDVADNLEAMIDAIIGDQ